MSSVLFSNSKNALLLAAAAAAFAAHLHPAVAAEITWSGAGNAAWATGGNWVGGNAPVNGDSILFTGSAGATNVNDLSFFAPSTDALAGITYAAGSTAFTTTGNELSVYGTLTNLSAQDQTLDIDVIMARTATPGSSFSIEVNGDGDIILPADSKAEKDLYVLGSGAGELVVPTGGSLLGTGGGLIPVLSIGNGTDSGKMRAAGTIAATAFVVTGPTATPAAFVLDGGSLTFNNVLDIGGMNPAFIITPEPTPGNASVSIINGGAVSAPSGGGVVSIGGSGSGKSSTFTVDGAGSSFSNTTNGTETYIAMVADATMTISNGGSATFNRLRDGLPSGSATVGGTGTATISILSGGTLQFNGQTYFGGGIDNNFTPLSGGTATIVVDGAGSRLILGNNTQTKYVGYDGTATLTVTNGGLADFGTGTVVVGNAAGSSGTVNIAGGTLTAGTITLGSAATSSGTLNFGDGTAVASTFTGTVSTGSGTGAVNFNTSANQTIAGNFTGAGLGIANLGSGTTTLTGTSTFGGGVTITAGTVAAGSAGALGSSGTISFGTGTLQYSANNQTDYSGRFSAAASQPYRVDTNAQDVTFASALTSSGGTLTKLGTGTLTLTGANTYSGGTTVSAGTLAGTTTGLQGAITNNATVELSQATAGTYAGVISGTGNLVKTGSGAVTLSGNNTYGGTTTVSAGSLLINGDQSSATGSLSVLSGATLGGSGTIGGNVSVAGTHAPGNSPAIQTVNGDLTYSSGSTFAWELIANTTGSAGTSYDQVSLPTGNLVFSGATALTLSFDGAGSVVDWENNFWSVDRNWLIHDLSGGTTTGIGNFTITTADWQDSNSQALSASSRAGATFNIALVGQDVTLNYVAPVPEPEMLGLVAIGLTGAGVAFRKRRRAA